MDRLDRVWLCQHQQIVVAAQVARPIGETFATEVRLAEFMRLDHRAHGAVEHKNALCGGGTKFIMAIGRGNFGHQAAFVSAFGPQAEQVADRIDEIRAIHRVEMEMLDASVNEVEDLFGGDGRGRSGDGSSDRRRDLQTVRLARLAPWRQPLCEARGLTEILHRYDAGDNRDRDAAIVTLVEKTEIDLVLEEELGDGTRCAGIDFGFQDVDVLFERGAFRMAFGIGRDRDLEISEALEASDQCCRIGVAFGMWPEALTDTALRIAAQRHDVAHADIPIRAGDFVDLRRGWRRRRSDAPQA